ncbi:MAG: nickel pincer cofactor biosynthesis protein LarC [Lachnospiraceae bacterium]|nr:nickel pincer cofactor biosynthesis protein LarC [Lachnospiraceae bacterium]
MKVMYIDCGMGAAGDMLTAALLELIPDREDLVRELNGIWRDGVETVAKSAKRCGIRGTLVDVLVDGRAEGEAHEHEHEPEHEHEHDHDHVHATLSDVMSTIQGMNIPENVKRDAGEIYRIIADAESRVHGEPVGEIHFHEVGMYDAIADVVSVCLLMDRIKPDRVVASPVNTGSGTVHCAHGVMPVPAPAAALILTGIPVYNDEIKGELCTPTGAALLKYYVNEFGNMPLMRTERTGYGLGHKDFPRANCVRVMLGETEEADKTDRVTGLSCNVDDMTGEELGYAIDRLMEKGAKEAYVVPVVMKKSRPGYELNVLCDTSDREMMVGEIFRLTSTIGIRETLYSRYVMDRTTGEMYTSYGRVRVKESSGYGVTRRKFEYDDLKAIADKEGIGIGQARQMIDRG